jgi:predicted chitinase
MSILTPPITDTAKLLITSLKKVGITNKFLVAGILGTIYKETNFKLRPEVGYGNTANARIRMIFGKRVADLTEDQLTALKADDVKFFEKVYGGRYGNSTFGDGFKYRGRGFNGLTFKGSYIEFGNKIKQDLVGNPDLLNQIPIAADALVAYYRDVLQIGVNKKYITRFGVQDLTHITDITTGTKIANQVTVGWASTPLPEGQKKALLYAPDFLPLLS